MTWGASPWGSRPWADGPAAGGAPTTYYRALGGLITAFATATKKNRDNTITGAITPSGSLSARIVIQRALSGSLTAVGLVRRKVRKGLVGAVTAAGTLLKRTRRALSGAITSLGSIRKATRRRLQASLASAGSLTQRFITRKTLLGSSTLAGAVARVFTAFTPSTPGDGSNKSALMGSHRRR